LIGNGVYFRPLRKIIHSDQEISVSLVASWEGSCYIDGYSFGWSPDIILVDFTPIPGPEAATCRTDIALSAPSLDIASCLEPIVPLPYLIQGFVDLQVT
jgi:hypothetical protein